jgi:hypothetical protein
MLLKVRQTEGRAFRNKQITERYNLRDKIEAY